MDLADFVFFLLPGEHGDRSRLNIISALKERMATSDKSPARRVCSEETSAPRRRISGVSGVEPGNSGRIPENSGARRGNASYRNPVRLPQPRITSALGCDEKLEHIRRKIASGYYNTTGHMEELADVLLEKMEFLGPVGDDDIFEIRDD